MKIALTGAHGTGKTTILNKLKELFPEERYVTEVVRKLAQEGIDINESGNHETQLLIFETYFNKLQGSFISDRCLVDVLSYTMASPHQTREMVYVGGEQVRMLDEWLANNKDIFFIYFPIEFDIVNDGVRSTDKDYQVQIDANIKLILNKFNIPHLTVHGTVEERLEQIVNYTGIKNESH